MNLQCLLSNRIEHDRTQQSKPSVTDTFEMLASKFPTRPMFDSLHPTTPKALPFARTSRGKISAGYSHGTVSHVAPNTNVKMYTKLAAAAPYELAAEMLPASRALRPRRDMPPARNMAMPWPMEPQYLQHVSDVDRCALNDSSLQCVSSTNSIKRKNADEG